MNTAAEEVCDGVDNDCDGSVDPDTAADALTFYADGDDGFGDALTTTTACEAPSGYVDDATDCDDTDATGEPGRHRGLRRRGIDEDCDGSANQVDADGDGFIASECGSADCDDTATAINPGPQTWYDGTDQDCDASDFDADSDGFDSTVSVGRTAMTQRPRSTPARRMPGATASTQTARAIPTSTPTSTASTRTPSVERIATTPPPPWSPGATRPGTTAPTRTATAPPTSTQRRRLRLGLRRRGLRRLQHGLQPGRNRDLLRRNRSELRRSLGLRQGPGRLRFGPLRRRGLRRPQPVPISRSDRALVRRNRPGLRRRR